jgi:hypothetical protein
VSRPARIASSTGPRGRAVEIAEDLGMFQHLALGDHAAKLLGAAMK